MQRLPWEKGGMGATLRGHPNRRSGMTLIEVVISASILAIAMVALVSALLSGMRLREVNKEKALARNAAEQALSAIRGMGSGPQGIVDAYIRFGGGGGAETFDVYGLASPAPGESVGRVIVWRRKDGNPPDPLSALVWAPADLQEARARFGMNFPLGLVGAEGPFANEYLDTDGNGTVNGADSPNLMPVTVRIRWRSRSAIVSEYYSTVVGLK